MPNIELNGLDIHDFIKFGIDGSAASQPTK